MMHTTTHDESKRQYFYVWGALLGLTLVEIYLAYEQVFHPLTMLIVLLALSLVKAGLIIAYFMHMKFEVPRMRWLLMGALVLCLVLMTAFFPDAFRIVQFRPH